MSRGQLVFCVTAAAGQRCGQLKPHEKIPSVWSQNLYVKAVYWGSHTVLLFSLYFLSLRSAPGVLEWPIVDKLRKMLFLSDQMERNRERDSSELRVKREAQEKDSWRRTFPCPVCVRNAELTPEQNRPREAEQRFKELN